MYAYLKGKVIEISPDHTILDVGGIGYLVYTPLHLYTNSPQENKEIFLHISFQVREDSMRLFGFLKRQEKELFEKLISISGLGPKTAMAIIGQGDTMNLPNIILQKDAIALTKVPGIGKKTAERIIIELSDKVSSLANSTAEIVSPKVKDAISALMSLGYKEKEANACIKRALEKASPKTTLSELISLSLSRT